MKYYIVTDLGQLFDLLYSIHYKECKTFIREIPPFTGDIKYREVDINYFRELTIGQIENLIEAKELYWK